MGSGRSRTCKTASRSWFRAIRGTLDLRQRPLVERKKRLARLVQATKCPRLLYAQYILQHAKAFFAEICRRDLEGIVAKRKLGIYKDDQTGWLKVKNPSYSQAEGRHELLTRGR